MSLIVEIKLKNEQRGNVVLVEGTGSANVLLAKPGDTIERTLYPGNELHLREVTVFRVEPKPDAPGPGEDHA